jgi:hypothetical protein
MARPPDDVSASSAARAEFGARPADHESVVALSPDTRELPSRPIWRDRIALAALAAVAFATSLTVNVHERLHEWSAQHPPYDVYRLLPVAAGGFVLTLAYLVVTRRRLRQEVVIREEREEALRHALHKIDVLSGLLSMCASCKRVRDENAQWEPVELYLERHGEVAVSHDLCPPCARELFPDFVDV